MIELKEPLESLIRFPKTFTAGTGFPRAGEIRLYDTTLRDGERTPGPAFTPEQKYELHYAHLDRLGLTEEDLLAYALVLGRDAD